MQVASARTPLAELLIERIRANGPITFAEFMRECLYHPEFGYYNRSEAAARIRDYFTSVDVHPIFGRLLARQLAEMWELLDRPARFDVVECGAGIGRLASHILDFSARVLPEFYSALRYTAVEQSAPRRVAQEQFIARHITAGRAASAASLPEAISVGCIFSNELFDALPVHRVLQMQGRLCELLVGLRGGEFCELPGAVSRLELSAYFAGMGIRLLEGQQAEVSLEACDWMHTAGRASGRGFVLSIDYGHEAEELYNERHMRGTLLAYHNHRSSEDYFARPAEQDLTAHVNFTALDLAGRAAGLVRTGLVSQSQFLLALGRTNDFADLYEEGQSEAEKLRARLKLKTLIHPEGMGETFQVFIQHKGIEALPLTGLLPL
jgi:SAM-dependent MidA family methyltransferase